MLHSKNRSEGLLPIPGAIVEILADPSECGSGDLIFVNRFGGLRPRQSCRRVWESAGLLEDRPGTKMLHDLRATAATFMIEAGASTETLRFNLG